MADQSDRIRIKLEDTPSYLSRSARLRVYIACSLTNEDRPELRDQLLNGIRTILDEAGFDVYDPSQHTEPGSPHLDSEVAAIDQIQAMRCDLIFFLRDHPSLGMGIEAQIAADMLIPWGDAKAEGDLNKLCPLLAGLPNGTSSFRFNFGAERIQEFIDQFRHRLQDTDFMNGLATVRRDRHAASALIRQVAIGRTIRRQRLLLNLSARELGEWVDLDKWWIIAIETNEELVDCLTFMQLVRLIEATRLRFVAKQSTGERLTFPRLEPIDSFSPELLEAADKFTMYSLSPKLAGQPSSESDLEMLAHWKKWLREEKDLPLPEPAHRPPALVSDLSVYIARPLSHISDEEKAAGEAVTAAVKTACNHVPGVSVRVVTPQYLEQGRHDCGEEIYLRAVSHVCDCDCAIALATPPATGVGVMARLFADLTVPCVAIAESGTSVSRMFLGMCFRRIGSVIKFASPDVVPSELQELLTTHLPTLLESASRRRSAREKIVDAARSSGFSQFVSQRTQTIGDDFEEPSKHFPSVPFVRSEWLDGLSRDPSLLATVTLLQFVHIANTLKWRMGVTESGVPCFLHGVCGVPQQILACLGDVPFGGTTTEQPSKQQLLPGIDDPAEIETRPATETASDDFAVVSFLLTVAKHGLPDYIIGRATGICMDSMRTLLMAKKENGEFICKDGIWAVGRDLEFIPPENAEEVLCRAFDGVLTVLECENDTAFVKSFKQNAIILEKKIKSLPSSLAMRLRVLRGERSEVQEYVRRRMQEVTNTSVEYADLLVLLGSSVGVQEEAKNYLNEAIEVCDSACKVGDTSDANWKKLLGRALVARSRLSTHDGCGIEGSYLSRVHGLLCDSGDTLAASAVQWRLLHSQGHISAPHFRRASSESPLVRVRAASLINRTPPPKKNLMGRRAEVPDAEWDACITRAREMEPWND